MSDDIPAAKRGGRRPKHGAPMVPFTFRWSRELEARVYAAARERRVEPGELVRELVERGVSYTFLPESERVM